MWSRTLSICLTTTKHTPIICRLLSLWFSSFCLFRQCFYWLSFFNEKLISLYAFYGLQNAAYNNVFNINVQDFCGSMTVCFVFFVLLMLIKRGWKLKAVTCCCAVVVMPLSFYIIHPVASVLGMRCKEYLRLFYILVVFMYVYIPICISTWLRHSNFIDRNIPLMSDSVVPSFLFCCWFWFWVSVLVHPP